MNHSHPLLDTFALMLREQMPNLFRLYVNPHVTQACFCLEHYIQTTWPRRPSASRDDHGFQTYLANGFEEALGGAIKLARYASSLEGRCSDGLVIDFSRRLGYFASSPVGDGQHIDFIPGLTAVETAEALAGVKPPPGGFGFVAVIAPADDRLEGGAETMRRLVRISDHPPLLITCVDRHGLAALREPGAGVLGELPPDIVVFDDSFADADVPFGAFTARRTLYDYWNQPGKTTFHSTTYQPNTISSLHFMRCLAKNDPDFRAGVASELARIERDPEYRAAQFRRLYSPSLLKITRVAGFDVPSVRAAGDFVFAGARQVFDAVSGVACSVRGHNPGSFVSELEALGDVADPAGAVARRLRELTGLECALPSVSGATAVENALKLALVAQWPRRRVLALKSGFGGKTLFALTGTWKSNYKQRIEPLYDDVVFVDPFAPDAIAKIDSLLQAEPVAVVQLELIQGVGGVRPIPRPVLEHLARGRERFGYLLLIDEVQTGMYRTGPFARCLSLGIRPDLLVVGKGVSDMMFPFALLMYGQALEQKLNAAGSTLPQAIRERYGYSFGYKTVLNALSRAADMDLPRRVVDAGETFSRQLREALEGTKAVRDIRVFGMLIGVELNAAGTPRRLLGKRLFQIYLLAMLRHPRYPVLVGFCQYEPNILKITPSLSAAPADLERAGQTIVEVLRKPLAVLLASLGRQLVKSRLSGRPSYGNESAPATAHEPAAC